VDVKFDYWTMSIKSKSRYFVVMIVKYAKYPKANSTLDNGRCVCI
jgi:hypothetical protein